MILYLTQNSANDMAIFLLCSRYKGSHDLSQKNRASVTTGVTEEQKNRSESTLEMLTTIYMYPSQSC